MSRKIAAVLGLALALAGLLTVSGVRLAASQGATITAMRTDARVPWREPWDPYWEGVPMLDVPLSAQQVAAPMGGHRWTLRAGAVQDADRVYIVTEWADASPDRSVDAPQDFTDAVAVQFPAVAGAQVPAFCMGDPAATVNIWQWRAAWQADVHRGFQGAVDTRYPNAVSDWYQFHGDDVFYPGRYAGNPFSTVDRVSAVDNLVAGGFGSLTADPLRSVQGWGAWRDGTWRVVFSRPLAVAREGNVELHPSDLTDVAFAVWDGAAEERNGMKSVASFVKLNLVTAEMEERASWPFWPAPFFVFVAIWVGIVWLIAVRETRRQPA